MNTAVNNYDTVEWDIGTYALPYLVNGDATGLNDDDQYMVDKWFAHAAFGWEDADGNKWAFTHIGVLDGTEKEFSYDEISGYYGVVQTVAMHFCKTN